MVKKPKEVTSIRIDPDLNEICDKLKLNKGPIVERALKLEVMRRLKLMKFDKMAIQQGLIGYLQEEKQIDDANDLVLQRLEQEEYVRTHEKAARAEQDQSLLREWHTFCTARRLNESQFAAYILGDVDGWTDHSREEHDLIQHLKQVGLTSDLNLLRPLLLKKAPVLVVR